jgi:hypothetical protein
MNAPVSDKYATDLSARIVQNLLDLIPLDHAATRTPPARRPRTALATVKR